MNDIICARSEDALPWLEDDSVDLVVNSCKVCNGIRWLPCPACGEYPAIMECARCLGTKQIRCPKCEGIGQRRTEAVQPQMKL